MGDFFIFRLAFGSEEVPFRTKKVILFEVSTGAHSSPGGEGDPVGELGTNPLHVARPMARRRDLFLNAFVKAVRPGARRMMLKLEPSVFGLGARNKS